jgi:hypothetical protein
VLVGQAGQVVDRTGGADMARRILIDNPLRFYGVPATNEEVGPQPVGTDQARVRPRPRRRRLFAAAEG